MRRVHYVPTLSAKKSIFSNIFHNIEIFAL